MCHGVVIATAKLVTYAMPVYEKHTIMNVCYYTLITILMKQISCKTIAVSLSDSKIYFTETSMTNDVYI